MRVHNNYRSKILIAAFCFLNVLPLFALTENETEISVRQLIERVLPGQSTYFDLNVIAPVNGHDLFEIDKNGNRIVLRGNNPVSLAVAFNTYLTEVACVSYSWEANGPLKIDRKLPLPQTKIQRTCSVNERFFNNTCTFGYTFPYWDWQKWERFIDWMAMNGINRPLMQTGQEAAWLEVWKSFGMTDQQVCSFFSAPAHLPWHRMGNMDSWGGPLPLSYIEQQSRLQKQILQRCRLLGMKPILSAFAGHVPKELQKIYPKVKISTIEPGWGGMDSTYTTHFLDPQEPLFAEIQKRFITTQQQLYGNDHLYSADPFNEISPPSWESNFLARVSKSIYESMSNADPKAVWYQMSWTFYFDTAHWTQPRLAAMIHEVPKGKLVFLDYVSEEQEYFLKSDAFHGAPFIWCYLGNFGGNTHLVAPLHKVMTRLKNVRQNEGCIGIGSTLEGINVNPIIYEMVLQAPWLSPNEMDVQQFIRKYADRRSGNADPAVRKAWEILSEKVLVDTAVGIWNHCTVFQMSPVLDYNRHFWSTNADIPYSNIDLLHAIDYLLQGRKESKKADAYQYDLVNLTRQLLGNYGFKIYSQITDSYRKKDLNSFQKYSDQFIRLGLEIDSLLGTRHEFLLGNWISDASKTGKTQSEKDYYTRDAREIITIWHKGGGGLTDYSNRQWNGLISSYYIPRWQEFFNRLKRCLQTQTPFDEKEFTQWGAVFEQNWVDNNHESFTTKTQSDPVVLSEQLIYKYKNSILSNR
ncbi:MAG: Alpha-N-acetylglucosaminidase [Bacteroidetes bacterium]|nr:Alpha-N-acetylglucosaminidase [Bacteroidota bacterium]